MGVKFLKNKGSRDLCSLLIKLIQTILIFIILFSFYIDIANAQIVVRDFRGKIIHLDKPVERVVCLIESALTGIYMLKQGHKVVGIPTNVYTEGFYYSDTFKYYALLDERIREKKIPAVGNWEFVNVEKVLSLKPDLIIIWANQRDTIEILERLGIPVYGVFITKIDDILKEIRDFGILFNAKKRAEELIRYIKEEIRKIEEIAKKIKSKKRIYFSWAQHSFLQTSCGGSIVDEIINTIGAINVCGNIKAESQNLTMEKLILLNPDIIIMWYSKTLKSENIKKNKQYKIINAIKNKAVYQFDDTFFFDLWTLKFLYSMKFIAKVSYPEYYKFELAKEKQRIMRLLYDKDLI